MAMRFDMVGLFVGDLARMVAFYRDTLGLEIEWDDWHAACRPYAELQHEGIRFSMYQRDQLPALLGQQPGFPHGLNGTFELAIDLKHSQAVDVTYERVLRGGGRPVYAPRHEPWGMRSSMIADPEGGESEFASDRDRFVEPGLTRQVPAEPAARQPRHLRQGRRLGQQVGAARDERQLALALQLRAGAFVHLQGRLVRRPDHQQNRHINGGHLGPRQVQRAVDGHQGRQTARPLGGRHKGRRRPRALPEVTQLERGRPPVGVQPGDHLGQAPGQQSDLLISRLRHGHFVFGEQVNLQSSQADLLEGLGYETHCAIIPAASAGIGQKNGFARVGVSGQFSIQQHIIRCNRHQALMQGEAQFVFVIRTIVERHLAVF